jgi:hypothetical protein
MNELLGDLGNAEVIGPIDVFRSEKAGAIRALGKNIVRDVIEIGRHLSEVKRRVGRGNWLPWLKSEFEWTDRTARNFISVYELSRSNWKDLSNLDLPMDAFYALAAPSTPAEVRDHMVVRRHFRDMKTKP